jgi:hypothetical protein
MGTRRTPKLTEAAICALYRSGASRADICLRAGIYDRELVRLLHRHGVPPRDQCQIKALSTVRRLGTLALNPPRKRCLCA